ncbi:MAG: hypothetical protein QOD94_2990 [Alphaproteobacteria bacterium]|jgi:hypothetical protein|nr:hypothetical protein [Alphaproteobacteria bacterium]
MVEPRHLAAVLAAACMIDATPALAQSLSRELFDCERGHCVLMEASPSFSNLGFEIATGGQSVDETSGKGVDYNVELTVIQPFETTPYGPGVNEMGLGSVRSGQLHVALTPLPAFDPGNPDPGPEPSVTVELFASLGHRRMPAGVVSSSSEVDRFSYSLGLGLTLSPDHKASLAGRLKYRASLQYRRQFLPDALDGSPVRIDNLIAQGGISGAWPKALGLASGVVFGLSAAYDFKTNVPGAELELTTRLLESPLNVIVGVRGWMQGRDENLRTRDKRWDLAPIIIVKF